MLALVQNQYHLYLLRFLLGAAEGGFFPGILYYLTLWFPDRVRGRMTSLFVMAVPLGGVIAGPLSGLIMDRMQGVHGLHGWQWLFILEGIPAVLLGVAAYLALAAGPQTTSWLNTDERRLVASDLARDRAAAPDTTSSFAAALREPRVYLLSFIYFAFFCSLNTILLWTPTLLKRVGVATTTEIGWLSGAISVASAIGMVAIGYSSDRTRERRWHVVACGLVAAACFIALQAAQGSILLTVTLLAVASIGIFAILSLFWTIPNAMLEGSAAAGGIALISAIGSFGGAVCPALIGWMNVATGSIYAPLALVGALLAIGMLTLILCVPRPGPEVTFAEPSRP